MPIPKLYLFVLDSEFPPTMISEGVDLNSSPLTICCSAPVPSTTKSNVETESSNLLISFPVKQLINIENKNIFRMSREYFPNFFPSLWR